MKFHQLFEMPTFINQELPIDDVPVEIMSVDTLESVVAVSVLPV